MWLNSFRNEIETKVLRFLWRQWAELGVSASGVNLEFERDHWTIDPEALLLFSSVLARHDARLFDEIMDWLGANAAFMNIPRLKSVARSSALGDDRVIAAMADVVGQHHSRLNWRFTVSNIPGERSPLFFAAGGEPMPSYGKPDETFLRFGFTRGRVELRGRSGLFNQNMPECALLRLRALFGVSARAEIILYLLTHETGYPTGIARETGFSQKNIHDTMVDLSSSGFIFAKQVEGRKRSYFMRKNPPPPFLHAPDQPPEWVTWPPLFKALQSLLAQLRATEEKQMSENLLASELRRITDEIRPFVEKAGFVDILHDARGSSSKDYMTTFKQNMARLMKSIRSE